MYGERYWDRARSETVAGEWQAVERQESYPLTLSNAIVPTLAGLLVSAPAGIAAMVLTWLATDLVLWWVGVLTMAIVWFAIAFWVLSTSLGLFKRWESYTGGRGGSESEASEKVIQTLRLEVIDEQGHKMQFFGDLPISQDDFALWARGVLGGRSLAQSEWTGSAGIFSRPVYRELLDYLMRAGLVRWVDDRHHAQGCELSAVGRSTLRRFVDSGGGILEG